MKSEMKRSGQGQLLSWVSFKIWIMLYYLKWIREHRDREIEQLISINSWYNTVLWLISRSQTVLWLAWWTFNRWISKVETDTHTNKVNLIDCWTATFAVKNRQHQASRAELLDFGPGQAGNVLDFRLFCNWFVSDFNLLSDSL